MFEALDAPLQDTAAYWERLGLEPAAATGDVEADIALLDRLILAHQQRICFECLDSRYGLAPISLEVPALYRKIIEGQRGGFCYELNSLFRAFLRSCGFTVTPVVGRVVRMATGFESPLNHQGLIVHVGDQPRYADVGFGGPMAACSLPLEDGSVTTSCGHEFQVSRVPQEQGPWWGISYRRAGSDDAFEPVLFAQDFPASPTDFLPLSWYSSTDPDSVFKTTLIMNRRTETGNVSLREGTLTRTVNGQAKKMPVPNDQLAEVIEREFLIKAPKNLPC